MTSIDMNFRKFKKKEIFKGDYLSLNIAQGRIKGREISFETVAVPDSVAVLAFVPKRGIVLIRQFRHPIGQDIWEIPAGHIEKNEKPEDTARRELIEEVGFETKKLKKIGAFFISPGYSTEKMYFFKANGAIKRKRALEDGEFIKEVRVFSGKEVTRMLEEKKINDAKTVLGLLCLKKVKNVF